MIKCMVVDDEKLAREAIITYINRMPELNVAAECENAIEAMMAIRKHKVDLIFLDIEMPEISGIEFLKSLKNIPHVIFTTAYRNYAVDAFDLNVIDFLLKPISFDRFLKAVNKVFDLNSTGQPTIQTNDKQDLFINVKADRKTYKVSLHDIVYIESIKDYVKIITAEESIITHDTITNQEKKLPESQFVRIHRSFIINKNHVQAFDAETVYMDTKKELPISRTYKLSVLQKLSD